MMKKAIAFGGLILTTALLAGCAQQATVFPMANGEYSLVSTSSQQRDAEQKAVNTAEKLCKKQHKKLIVLGHTTKYQGINKKDAAVLGIVGDVAGALAKAGNAGGYSSSSNNYQVTMRFRCV